MTRSSWRSRPRTPSHTSRPASNRAAGARRHAPQDAAPRIGQPAVVEVLHARAFGFDVVERDIEAAVLPVAIEILPEIRQLQRRAERVGRAIEPWVVVPGNPKHQPADRIGRSAAVVEHALPRVVAMRRDILTKRAEQIVEERHWKIAGADGRAQREKHTVVRMVAGGTPASVTHACSRFCQSSSTSNRSSSGRRPSSAKSSAVRANAYTAATCGRMRGGSSHEATGKFS